MNIFVLHADPRRAAQFHCDKHVVVMIKETVQILSTAHHLAGGTSPVKPTHMNHPCAVWARDCDGNYGWLRVLGVALSEEYTYRYGRVHAYDALLRGPLAQLPRRIKFQRRKPFVYVGPEQYARGDPVASYRACYIGEKSRFARWTRRDVPKWFQRGN